MNDDARIRIRMNPHDVIKLASLVSNSLLLSANIVMLSHDVHHRVQEKKAIALSNRLEMTAEVADAIAGLAKVIINVIDER